MKASEQLKGWAVDRAIEALKVGRTEPINVDSVIETAQKLVDYCISAETMATIDNPAEEGTVQ